MAKRDDFIDREPATGDFGLIVRLVTPTTPIPVTPSGGTSSTGTLSNVSGSASSVTLLASNTSRLGATIYNDSSAILYIKLNSGAATTTSFTYKAMPEAYYEVPFGYTGAITGIWASATGAARVEEFTA